MLEEASNRLQQTIKAIEARYAPRIEELKREGEQLECDVERPSDVGAVIKVDFDVEWKDQEVIFDVPSVTFKEQKIALDLPEVTSRLEHIAFHVPDVRMVNREIGRRPVIRWPKIDWEPIIISVPEPYMRRVDIKFDVPQVAMKRRDMSLKIPEFGTSQVRWSFKIPHFTVRNVEAEMKKIEERGEALRTKGEKLAADMKAEIEREVGEFNKLLGSAGDGAKQEIAAPFDTAANSLQTAINDLQAKGIDPIKVPTEKGDLNLRKMLSELTESRAKALQAIGS